MLFFFFLKKKHLLFGVNILHRMHGGVPSVWQQKESMSFSFLLVTIYVFFWICHYHSLLIHVSMFCCFLFIFLSSAGNTWPCYRHSLIWRECIGWPSARGGPPYKCHCCCAWSWTCPWQHFLFTLQGDSYSFCSNPCFGLLVFDNYPFCPTPPLLR